MADGLIETEAAPAGQWEEQNNFCKLFLGYDFYLDSYRWTIPSKLFMSFQISWFSITSNQLKTNSLILLR